MFLRETNRIACYVIPVAQDTILLARDGLKTVSYHGQNSWVI